MSEGFKLEIINPEKSFLLKDSVLEVVVPAFEGDMGILKDHISIISFLKPGLVKVFTSNSNEETPGFTKLAISARVLDTSKALDLIFSISFMSL